MSENETPQLEIVNDGESSTEPKPEVISRKDYSLMTHEEKISLTDRIAAGKRLY